MSQLLARRSEWDLPPEPGTTDEPEEPEPEPPKDA
jgi:hypothetical protein